MTLFGPDRDEVVQWNPNEPELMKQLILAGAQVQMPIKPINTGTTFNPCTLCGDDHPNELCPHWKDLEPGKDCIRRIDV